eukprot:4765_1
MDPFNLFSSSKTDLQNKSVSTTPSAKHKEKRKKRSRSNSQSKKTIFESDSSDDTYSSYSHPRSQINNENESSASLSSSDLEIAQLDDFRPLLRSSNRNTPKRKPQGPVKMNKHLNAVDTKFGKISNNIHEFRSEINSIKSMNRKANDPQRQSNLTIQIQHETNEQDEVLDDMKTVLERLAIMSQDIGNEIAEQDDLIKDTTHEADFTHDRLKRVEQQMTQLMQKRGLTPCKVIIILTCLAILLVFLILYF